MDNKLWYHINGGYLHNYLQTTHRWTTKVWDSIDMEALSQHLKKLTAPHQTTCSSQVHSQLSTLGVSNFRQAKVQDPNLKWCRKDADKTQPHLMGCKANLQQKDALAMLLKTIMSDDAHHIGTMLSICINKIRIISCCVVSINRKHPHPPLLRTFHRWTTFPSWLFQLCKHPTPSNWLSKEECLKHRWQCQFSCISEDVLCNW